MSHKGNENFAARGLGAPLDGERRPVRFSEPSEVLSGTLVSDRSHGVRLPPSTAGHEVQPSESRASLGPIAAATAVLTGSRAHRTLVDLLRDDALRLASQQAFTFLGSSGAEEDHLSYGELDASARAIGATLQSFGAAGERVLLLYPPGLEFIRAFFGCLYSGAIAVPVPSASRRARSLRGLQSIIADARPSIALTTSSGLGFIKRTLRELVEVSGLRWQATDIIAPELQDEWWDPMLRGENIAYLQYTSGSTSTPKGVVLTHCHVLENSDQIGRALEYDAHSIAVTWLPHFHDSGLVNGVIQPLFSKFRSVMMSPLAFVQRPFRWLEAISRYQATHSGGPNFGYALCTRRVSPRECDLLDLRSWRYAHNAAEPVRKKTLDEFARVFGPSGFRPASFYPAYGLAEATLLVSIRRTGMDLSFRAVPRDTATDAGKSAGHSSRVVVGCGPSIPNAKIVIARPDTLTDCASGEEGEIWVSGSSVAGKYWERPDDTRRTFQAFLDSGEGPFLRTGDLGFLHNDELFITGRLKDLIIIRGQNHYPQDIESTVEEAHPAVRTGGCAAFSIETGQDEGLVIFAELQQRDASVSDRAASVGEGGAAVTRCLSIDTERVGEIIRQAVAEAHGLYIHELIFVSPGMIPRTSSGKIQRHACKAEFLEGMEDPLGVWHGKQTRR